MTKTELLENLVDYEGEIDWSIVRAYDTEHGPMAAKKVVHESLSFNRLAMFSLGDDSIENSVVFL